MCTHVKPSIFVSNLDECRLILVNLRKAKRLDTLSQTAFQHTSGGWWQVQLSPWNKLHFEPTCDQTAPRKFSNNNDILTLIQLDQPVGVRETVNKHYFSRDEGRALMAYQRLLDERRGMHFLVSVLQGDRRPAEVETFALQRFFWVKKVLSVVPTCLLNLGNGLLTDIS
ncbi:hypothetical protein PGT21_016556 [Puccinia graminis f. sp. tritici]|uniref:Uncharacterized protein n=1 Tax=Puccinia graminis f. sp. tritici TaxID=56615 RepID=A0A5B0M3L0_PUCGR|nr:hypothetical protein PGT21_016556 [Puccinia graminis f. sp. tritici]KAA1089826.1 hypothetical protein PGTUg99_020555 [Puccinia graminis f. sp. tritici]